MNSREFFKLVYQMRKTQKKAKEDKLCEKSAMVAEMLVDMEIERVDKLYTENHSPKFWEGK